VEDALLAGIYKMQNGLSPPHCPGIIIIMK